MSNLLQDLESGVRAGDIVPVIGPHALRGVTRVDNGEALPVSGEELIIALNRGRPMAPKLMYEFPRAAMNVELKRGRKALDRFLTELYSAEYTRSPVHDWIQSLRPPYVVDLNRDSQLLDSYAGTPHVLITGVARISGSDFRFRLWQYDGDAYREVTLDEVDGGVPILFKPTGCVRPQPGFIASDADFVDYITELMGGFAIPEFLKRYRAGKRYLTLGLPLTRDTERMILSDTIYGAAEPAGWALLPEPTPKERRFCERIGMEVVAGDVFDLLGSDAAVVA